MSSFKEGDLLLFKGDNTHLEEWCGTVVEFVGPYNENLTKCRLLSDLKSWRIFRKGETVSLVTNLLVPLEGEEALLYNLRKAVDAARDGGLKVHCKVVKVVTTESEEVL